MGKRTRIFRRACGLLAVVVVASMLVVLSDSGSASALTTVSQIAAGGRTTCAVMSDTSAYCWGDNTYGQLGDGTTSSSATPVLVSGAHMWASISTQANANHGTTCGVTTSGVGYCWGYNGEGEVGDGSTTQRTSPTVVSGSHTWQSISVGWSVTCGVTTANQGYCWGYDNEGALGDNLGGNSSTPVLVNGGLSWATISVGNDHACGLTTGGAGYCWGLNVYGENGDGGTTNTYVPTVIAGSHTWSQITAGTYDACGVTTSGTGYCWGRNSKGEVGDTTTTEQDSPVAVSGSHTWSEISMGDLGACGLTTSGIAYCWGKNDVGQVGNGTTSSQVTSPAATSGGLILSSINSGWGDSSDFTYNNTNCGLGADGIAYCWGNNGVSQVGDGTTTDRNIPTEASLLFSVAANTNLSVTIIPSFTFAVNGQSSGTACDGLPASTVASTSTAVSFGNLAAGTRAFGTQQFQVATNAGGGYTIYMGTGRVSGPALRGSNGHTISDSGMSVALPAAGNEFFGYAGDSSTNGVPSGDISTVPWTNVGTDVGSGFVNPSGINCIEFAVGVAADTPADAYSTNIIYTAVPTF